MIRLYKVCVNLPGFRLDEVDLAVEPGEFFALLGPTGAGKTMILESICGLVKINGGKITINGIDAENLPPEKRGIGIVYQDSALFPHLSVADNITYGLRYHKKGKREWRKDLQGLAERLNIGHLLKRKPTGLSGGERQRVALARALIIRPNVILLDEPLSALDPNFREELRRLLKEIHKDGGITFVMVTHDFSEAIFLAERAAVINEGKIRQCGKISDIFRKPESPFVAEFVGMKNVFKADIQDGFASIGGLKFRINGKGGPGAGYAAFRPEDAYLIDSQRPADDDNVFNGRVQSIYDSGSFFEISVNIGPVSLQTIISKKRFLELRLDEGSGVNVGLKAEDIHVF